MDKTNRTRKKIEPAVIIYGVLVISYYVYIILKQNVLNVSGMANDIISQVYFASSLLFLGYIVRTVRLYRVEKRNKLSKSDNIILEAFLETRIIPYELQRQVPQLFDLDTTIAGYCKQLLKGKKNVELSSNEIISEDEKKLFLKLIDDTSGYFKEELVIYYRLLLSVVSILYKYRQQKQPGVVLNC